MSSDGRASIAGLRCESIEYVARAIADAVGTM